MQCSRPLWLNYNRNQLMLHRAQFAQWLPVPVERVFLFFANPGNLPRIMPPDSGTELLRVTLVPPPGASPVQATVTDQPPLAGAGSEIVTSFRVLPFLPFRATWTARIVAFEWNHFFEDVQEKGPFRSFRHRHELVSEERNGIMGTVVRDMIEYEVGFGFLGDLAQKFFVAKKFEKTFAYRQRTLEKLLGVKK
jgi:ligand-binding SRPBCC domain-containing protein